MLSLDDPLPVPCSMGDGGLPSQLADRLRLPLPGRAAQWPLAAEMSFGRHFGPAAHGNRAAAVMALLVERDGQWTIPLVERPSFLSHHAGQIALPGGLLEPGETPDQAALRELEEELGVPARCVRLLGPLSALYVFSSNHQIAPWVGVLTAPCEFVPNPSEVGELLLPPVQEFRRPERLDRCIQKFGAFQFSAPCYQWQDKQIWGATAMILAELLAVWPQNP